MRGALKRDGRQAKKRLTNACIASKKTSGLMHFFLNVKNVNTKVSVASLGDGVCTFEVAIWL
jgi:hypothetical protein